MQKLNVDEKSVDINDLRKTFYFILFKREMQNTIDATDFINFLWDADQYKGIYQQVFRFIRDLIPDFYDLDAGH